jgi:purine-cytosine permease-like protein
MRVCAAISAHDNDQLLKSKTVWFAILIAVLSVVQGYVALLPVTPVQQMLVGMVISVAVLVLRLITTQPISEK